MLLLCLVRSVLLGAPAGFASDQAGPSSIAVDGESVYWIVTGGSGRSVMKLTPK